MIDTLGIRSIPGSYDVSKDASLIVYPASYSLNDGEVKNDFRLFDIEGDEITGSKAILNREKYQVTIDARGMYIQLSVPKYARGSNYRLSDLKETKEVLKDLEKSLWTEGIRTNIEDAIPGRLDSCRNVLLDNSTGNYFSFIPSLGVNRMKAKSGYSTGIKRTGFQWANTRQEIICYDKRIEMQSRKEALTGIPKNVLRFEHRLRNGRKIKEALQFSTVRELVNDFGRIEDNYIKVMKETIFKYDAEDKRLFASNTIFNHLLHSLKFNKRNAFEKFAFGLMFADENLIIDRLSMFEMLEDVMKELNFKGATRRKYRFRLRQKYDAVKKLNLGSDTVNVRELYNELRCKVLKVA